jgi:serine/threonine protein kinase
MNKSRIIDGWVLGEFLGRGGNAMVWLATKEGVTAAFKLLSKQAAKRPARFRDEIEAMRRCADIPGVLPVFEFHSPADGTPGMFWLAMGRATPIRYALGENPSLRQAVEAVRDIARTLEKMHARGFAHRDLKPENLFRYEDRWTVGDFGLADFEGKGAKTIARERIGPVHYIAPEMLNNAAESDGAPADVFSIAKTLWVLATGHKFPLPGAYDISIAAFRMGAYVNETGTTTLDRLIAASTVFEPKARPTMSQFARELDAWLQPAPAAAPSPIRLDTSTHAARMERGKAAALSAQERERLLAERRNESGQRIRERFRTLASDIETSLRNANFDPVHINVDNYHWGFEVTAGIPNETPRLQIAVSINANEAPAISVQCQFLLQNVGTARASMLLWNQEVAFLDGGSEEDVQLARLDAMIRDELPRAVTTMLSLGIDRPTAATGNLVGYRVALTDTDGAVIPHAHILLLAADGVYLRLETNDKGVAKTGETGFAPTTAFIAHPAYPSRCVMPPNFGSNMQVTLKKDGQSGSMIVLRGWTALPGLAGQVAFIHDSAGRMYIYADNIAIDGGNKQPVDFELGQLITLRDLQNTIVRFTATAVLGPCFLIDIAAGP